LNFYQALKLIAEGKKVTKLEWENEKFYGVIDNEILKLHKDDDKLYNWILGAGDLGGEDYIEV